MTGAAERPVTAGFFSMSTLAPSRDTLLTHIRESGLVSARKLDKALAGCDSDDPNVILTHLVKAGLITEYHGRELYIGRNKGFFIGKYKVLEPLATGGMGLVLRCEHIHMHHEVALKLLPKELNDDTTAVTRFYREARAAAAVKHPNVVQAFDVGQEGVWHCLVMEYVDGINLHKLVTRHGALSEVRAAHYVAQAATGLQAIMQNDLVHRDLKPGNLILARDNTIKVVDLGLARFLDQRSDDLTRQFDEERVLGTADFISPEQALHSHDVDIRSDLYSLGMTFYFLLTGKFPFKAATVAGKLMSHQTKMPKALLARRPDVSPQLDAIITKMIQKRREDRYATPQEVVDELKPWTEVPLPMPDAAWFVPTAGLFAIPGTNGQTASAPSTPSEASTVQTARSKLTEVIDPPPEPATARSPGTIHPRAASAIEGLAELQEVNSFSMSRASREINTRSVKSPLQQLMLALIIAVPVLFALVAALVLFFKSR